VPIFFRVSKNRQFNENKYLFLTGKYIGKQNSPRCTPTNFSSKPKSSRSSYNETDQCK
jgi:hypothetical protein